MAEAQLYLQIMRSIVAQQLFGKTDRILIAISGGPDSVALTALLYEIQQHRWPELKLVLAHLNHQLRGAESARDEAFVIDLAAEFKLDLLLEQISVATAAQQAGENLEATARNLRYQFLQRAAHEASASVIVTGHNMNDQAETLLMRLIRGSGPQGLASIYPIIESIPTNNSILATDSTKTARIVRPLLTIKRSQIEAYLATRNLTSCLDSSNLDDHFTRNKIRHQIMPQLEELNPRVIETFARTAELLRAEFARPVAATNQQCAQFKLLVTELLHADPATRHQQLREAICHVRGNLHRISARHINSIDILLLPEKSGKRVLLPGGYQIARDFNYLIISAAQTIDDKANISDKTVEYTESAWLVLGNSCQFNNHTITFQAISKAELLTLSPTEQHVIVDLACTGAKLRIRTRRPGDRYQPIKHQSSEKLKNLMIENRISFGQRHLWPIVINQEDRIIWSPGLPVAQAFAAHATTAYFAIILAKC